MRYSFFFILLIYSCNNNNTNTLDNSPALSDSSNMLAPETAITTDAPKEKFTFDELPPLAIYVNEIFKQYYPKEEDVLPALALEENQVIYTPKQEYDEDTELSYFTPTSTAMAAGWAGTAGGEDWLESYYLVEDGAEPIVFFVQNRTEYFRSSMEEMHEDQEEIDQFLEETEQELKQAGVAEKDAFGMAESILARNEMNSSSECIFRDFAELKLSALQKKNGTWVDVTQSTFESNLNEQFATYFPFLTVKFEPASKGAPSAYVLEGIVINEEQLQANKMHWMNWFNTNEISDLSSLEPSFDRDNKMLYLNFSDKGSLKFKWNGKTCTTFQLPKQVDWMNNACPSIDFEKGGNYRFKGKIEEQEIIMTMKCSPNKEAVSVTGEYWYTKNTNSKFPIKGQLSKSISVVNQLNRMKDGKTRERFDCFFTDCKLKGWWQHQGSLKIYAFTLELDK